MKRGILIVLIWIFALIVLFSLSLASANNCEDSDGGKEYGRRGLTVANLTIEKSEMDFCMGSSVYEFYCDQGSMKSEKYSCPNGCKDGYCLNFVAEIENKSDDGNETEGIENETESEDIEIENEIRIEKKNGKNIIIANQSSVETLLDVAEEGKVMYVKSKKGNKEIKIMPDTASERAIERLGELNFTIVLKEVGQDAKIVYEMNATKEARVIGIFKAKAEVKAQVDAQTGEISVKKPWWAFLASGI